MEIRANVFSFELELQTRTYTATTTHTTKKNEHKNKRNVDYIWKRNEAKTYINETSVLGCIAESKNVKNKL